MADLRRTSRAAGPVVARVIGVIVVRAAVPLGSGENLMLNRRRVADVYLALDARPEGPVPGADQDRW